MKPAPPSVLRRLKRRLAPIALLLLSAHEYRCAAYAQTGGLSEDQIKAGFLLNFLRFVQWPDASYVTRSAPISVCIVGHNSMSAVLSEAVSGKEVDGHAIRVKLTKASDDLRTCHLVFVGSADERHTSQILDSLKGNSILTVGEYSSFAKSGGMLNFYTEENKVKLEMNLDAATRANLRISAKLIAVSHLISTKPAAKGL